MHAVVQRSTHVCQSRRTNGAVYAGTVLRRAGGYEWLHRFAVSSANVSMNTLPGRQIDHTTLTRLRSPLPQICFFSTHSLSSYTHTSHIRLSVAISMKTASLTHPLVVFGWLKSPENAIRSSYDGHFSATHASIQTCHTHAPFLRVTIGFVRKFIGISLSLAANI